MKKDIGLPPELALYFWDVDPEKLSLQKHSRYIIERLLEYGKLEAVLWVQKQYSKAMIMDVCLTSRRVSERSRNFWAIWKFKLAGQNWKQRLAGAAKT